jgi:hypothetical protein
MAASHSSPRPHRDVPRLLPAAIATAVVVLIAGAALGTILLRSRSSVAPDGVPSVLTPEFAGLALAGHARDVLVGVGARAGGPVDVVVVPSDESTVAREDVRVRLGRRSLSGAEAAACGERCLRFPLRVLVGKDAVLEVDVARPGKGIVRVPVSLPPRMPMRADGLFRAARARMLQLRSLSMDETLGSGLSKPVVSRWWFQAPDRMRYAVAGGSRAVVVGTRRWDFFRRRLERSSTSRLRIPAFPWEGARGTRVLGGARLEGTPVRVLAAWIPGRDFPTWFLLYVTPDDRVLRSRMLTTAHFMTDEYGGFDAVPAIRPPR